MLCTETDGNLAAVRIPKPVIDLASELYVIMDAIEQYGHGEGQISMKVQPGRKIPFIDWSFRKFRNKKVS